MSEFEKFKKKFLRKDYQFIRTYKKDFGEYIIGEHKRRVLANHRILIYHFTNSPTIKTFAKVVKDFERAFRQFNRYYNVEGGYSVVHGSYDKEGFKLILDRVEDKIYDLIKIVKLKEEKPEIAKVESITKETKTPELKQIISEIKRFAPPKRPKRERELDNMLVSYLSAFYDVRTKQTYERARIDAQIGKIGIEIKYEPNASEFDRLYGQVEKYLRHLDYVIAVIGYERSKENTRYFTDRLKVRGWLNDRVFVISIA